MPTLPVSLRLTGREVLVVGGGPVAARRVEALLEAQALVTVVAPDAVPALAELAIGGRLTWHKREFVSADVGDLWLAVTATGVPAVDALVSELCESRQIWCINSANSAQSTALPMTIARGPDEITVAVSGGQDPGRSRALRDAIEVLLHSGGLPIAATRPKMVGALEEQPGVGSVALVGTGPGDPALLTVAAMRAVAEADVLIVDRLAPAVLWQNPRVGVEVIDVGKEPGHHAVPQDEINAIIVAKAQAGHRVARLKGGDPFVLGRGGEEALACLAAGIPVRVIPGITSAISVPAAAGIPVTQRGITSTFVVASAHEGAPGVLAATAGAPANATLVLLMGVRRLPEIANGLIGDGRDPDTAVAVIESGWTPSQRTTVSTLREVGDGQVDIAPPAVVVVGDVVNLREQLGDLAVSSANSRHA